MEDSGYFNTPDTVDSFIGDWKLKKFKGFIYFYSQNKIDYATEFIIVKKNLRFRCSFKFNSSTNFFFVVPEQWQVFSTKNYNVQDSNTQQAISYIV